MNKMITLQSTENIAKNLKVTPLKNAENSEAKIIIGDIHEEKNVVTEKLMKVKTNEKGKKDKKHLDLQTEKNIEKEVESNKEKEKEIETEKNTDPSKKKKRKSSAGEIKNNLENIDLKITKCTPENKLQYLLPFFCRIFSFPMLPQTYQNKAIIVNTDNSTNADSNTEQGVRAYNDVRTVENTNTKIVNELCQAVLTKFGLNTCLEKLDFGNFDVNVSTHSDSQIISNDENVKKKIRIEEDSTAIDHANNVLLEKGTIGKLNKDTDESIKQTSNKEMKDKEESKKPLTRKEKRNERNSSKKNKKKKSTTVNCPPVKKIESEKELTFKSIMSQNILPNGFINFHNVFDKKKLIMKKEDSQVQDSEIKNEIENNKEDLIKKVDKIEEPPVLKVEICSGAGEWAIAQVCCGQNNKFRK